MGPCLVPPVPPPSSTQAPSSSDGVLGPSSRIQGTGEVGGPGHRDLGLHSWQRAPHGKDDSAWAQASGVSRLWGRGRTRVGRVTPSTLCFHPGDCFGILFLSLFLNLLHSWMAPAPLLSFLTTTLSSLSSPFPPLTALSHLSRPGKREGLLSRVSKFRLVSSQYQGRRVQFFM